MIVQNVGRWEINTGNHIPINENTVVIQIVDTDHDFPELKGTPFSVLQLKFLDVEDDDSWPSVRKHGSVTRAQIIQIAKVLEEAKEYRKDLLVHCEMGVSRSGAVVEVALLMGFKEATGCPIRHPNMLVKGMLAQELGLRYNPSESPFNIGEVVNQAFEDY